MQRERGTPVVTLERRFRPRVRKGFLYETFVSMVQATPESFAFGRDSTPDEDFAVALLVHFAGVDSKDGAAHKKTIEINFRTAEAKNFLDGWLLSLSKCPQRKHLDAAGNLVLRTAENEGESLTSAKANLFRDRNRPRCKTGLWESQYPTVHFPLLLYLCQKANAGRCRHLTRNQVITGSTRRQYGHIDRSVIEKGPATADPF